MNGGNVTSGRAVSGGIVTTGGAASGGNTSTDTAGSAGGSTGSGGTADSGGNTVGGSTGSTSSPAELVGWATEDGGMTGGGNATPVTAKILAELNTLAAGTDPKVINVDGKLTGLLTVGSNKTIIGMTGAEISSDQGVLVLTDSENVIILNFNLWDGQRVKRINRADERQAYLARPY